MKRENIYSEYLSNTESDLRQASMVEMAIHVRLKT